MTVPETQVARVWRLDTIFALVFEMLLSAAYTLPSTSDGLEIKRLSQTSKNENG